MGSLPPCQLNFPFLMTSEQRGCRGGNCRERPQGGAENLGAGSQLALNPAQFEGAISAPLFVQLGYPFVAPLL